MKKVMTRRTAREILIKIFYQADVNGDSDSGEYVETPFDNLEQA